MAMGKSFRVFERDNNSSPYSILLEQRNKDTSLMLESDVIVQLSAQEKETIKRQYSKVLDAYGSLGILQINVGNDVLQYLIMITGCISLGKISDTEIFRITQTSFLSLRKQPQDEEHISEVKKILNSGTFYFSWSPSGDTVDITLCAQKRTKTKETDNRFFWNRTLHLPLIQFGTDASTWLQKVMCGSVEIRTVYVGARQGKAVIISRLSSERTGTRFHVRGVNDEGHVANFVETEQAIYMENSVASYVQTRGSVPLFWEQTGVQVGQHKVKMSRGPEASAAAFDRHITLIKQRYGNQTIVNLLGTSHVGSKESEGMLSNLFVQQLKSSRHNDIDQIVFDYHQEMKANPKNINKLKDKLEKYIKSYSIFYMKGSDVLSEQQGTIRTNCLDCLDRTNCVQTVIGLQVLGKQLEMLDLLEKQQSIARFEEVFKQMWVDNGNEVSKIYAGTGAIQGGSKFMDGARSAARTIQNNLLDSSKQEAIDILLLGKALNSNLADRSRTLLNSRLHHLSNHILSEMCDRFMDYTKKVPVRLGVGTYNVNGGKHFRSVVYKDLSLTDWLLDAHIEIDNSKEIDLFAIGFEEIVDLNASNIMAVSTENAKIWAEELQKVLSRDQKYVLVTYIQLVGVCLFLFVREELSPYLRDIAIDSVKTGFGGATGNKGGVVIRCTLYNTSMTFICAHFAAGQSQVNERNSDYNEICRKITFPLGSNLKSQDYIIWCGDFNYRVDMDKEELKELLRENKLDAVLQCDQLRNQKEMGNVFHNYIEGEITFQPTYKYDLFSDDYDTSEKCRAPAWTDRVLWKRRCHLEDVPDDWSQGNLVHYGRTELKQSDHRPVIAVIDIEVNEVDEEKEAKIFSEVVKSSGPPDATVVIHSINKSLYADESFKTFLLDNLSQYGEVVIMRQVEDLIYVVFKDCYAAMLAGESGQTVVEGVVYKVSYRTADWERRVFDQIKLCENNTVALCGYSPALSEELRPQAPSRPPAPKGKAPPTVPPSPKRQPVGRPARELSSDSSGDEYRGSAPPAGPPPPLPTSAPPIPPRTNVPPPVPSRPK